LQIGLEAARGLERFRAFGTRGLYSTPHHSCGLMGSVEMTARILDSVLFKEVRCQTDLES